MAPRRVEPILTAAERRAAVVRASRAPRAERQVTEPPPWEREQWVDEGPIRKVATAAAKRALSPQSHADGSSSASPASDPTTSKRRMRNQLAPEIEDELSRSAPLGNAARYQERLATAADALERGRYEDARRMVQPVLRDMPDLAFGHELAGLALYRLGQWRKAAVQLEAARLLDRSLRHHPVLADCYRALRRYHEVDLLWTELKEGSPVPALMAEGRIVAAGARSDQGDLAGALAVMGRAGEVPKRVREHHLRQWYVIADLLDRSGDVIGARRYFGLVQANDPGFGDVADRLRAIGR